jgi:hypothetical protein
MLASIPAERANYISELILKKLCVLEIGPENQRIHVNFSDIIFKCLRFLSNPDRTLKSIFSMKGISSIEIIAGREFHENKPGLVLTSLVFCTTIAEKSKDLGTDVKKRVRQAVFWCLKKDKYPTILASCLPIILMCEFMTQEHLVLWSIVISCSILIITASLVPQRPPWLALVLFWQVVVRS